MTLPPHYRRNFAALLGDYIGFALGMTFASTTTVLPALVGYMTDSEVAVGLLSTVSNGAWLLPQLIYANLITHKRRKKPYVTLGAIIGRPFILFYAAALGLGIYQYPILALLLLFGAQIIFFGTDALAAVAWFDVVSKAIPDRRRGRLFGGGQLISGLLAIGAGAVIAALLAADGPPFPQNYAVILALAGFCLLFSLFSWLFVVEPDEPVEESRRAWRDYLPQLVNTLHQDRAFARLILVRLLAGCDGLALGFYVLFATRELGLPPETVGLFTAAQTVGRILSSVILGTLAERAGSHRVVQFATGIGMTAPLMGLALLLAGAQGNTTTAVIFAWVFLTIGVTISSGMLGYYNYVLGLAPTGQRPTYIGLLNTMSGVLVVLPTIGGWLLRATSYNVLFGLTAAILIIAHALSLSLPSARLASSQLQAEPAT
jgi:MFS family permease